MNTLANTLGMKLLDRLILLDLIPKLLMGVGLFSTLFFAFGPLLAAARFIEQGIPFWIVASFVGWNFTAFVSWTFPLGMMVAALLGFERLSRDSEAVALFAGGISFLRMIVPVAALGLVVSVTDYAFNDRIASYANQRVSDIKDHRDQYIGETTKPFDFVNRNEDGTLQVTVHVERGYDVLAKALRQVTITAYDKDGRPAEVFYADRAVSHGGGFKTWTLYDGFVSHSQGIPINTPFPQMETDEINKTADNINFLRRDPETLNFHDLRTQIAEMKASGSNSKDVRNAEVGLWFKTSLPFSCLIFGLVGAPLGTRPPRAVKMSGTFWALPIIIGYFIIYSMMSSFAAGGAVSPLLAAWLPNILGLFVGAGLIWKASR